MRDLDMSRIGDAAASDRYSITALMTKSRTYGESRDIQALVLIVLDDIIRTRKKPHAITLFVNSQPASPRVSPITFRVPLRPHPM